MIPDLGNAFFETLGAFFIWKSVAVLWKERQIKGVYWPAWVFYSAWGLWNLYYYPTMGQWFSFFAGCVLVVGNISWVVLAVVVKRESEEPPSLTGHYQK